MEALNPKGGDVVFRDRTDAGRRLAPLLAHLRAEHPVVVGLPRGGVPVAAEVARELGAPLDVLLVRKLGVPHQPELAMGAIGEGGVRVRNEEVLARAGVDDAQVDAVERRELAELERRVAVYRGGRPGTPLAGRVVIVVDDGIATGSTARAACQVARAAGAARIVLAVPVAPPDWERRLGEVADELVAVSTPRWFFAIGQHYDDFRQTTDEEVLAAIAGARRDVAGDQVDDEPGARASGSGGGR